MSGGSYNYLFNKDPEELFEWGSYDELERMKERLAGLGYADDAAEETLRLLLKVRQVRIELSVIQERLGCVWKAIEWWDSGDASEDQVKDALSEYRGNE